MSSQHITRHGQNLKFQQVLLINNINDSLADCQWKIFEYMPLRCQFSSSLFSQDISVESQVNPPSITTLENPLQFSSSFLNYGYLYIQQKPLYSFAFIMRQPYLEGLGFLLDAPSQPILRIPIFGRIYFSPEILVVVLVLQLLVEEYYY